MTPAVKNAYANCLNAKSRMKTMIVSIVIVLVLPRLVKVVAKATLAGLLLQTTLMTAWSK